MKKKIAPAPAGKAKKTVTIKDLKPIKNPRGGVTSKIGGVGLPKAGSAGGLGATQIVFTGEEVDSQ